MTRFIRKHWMAHLSENLFQEGSKKIGQGTFVFDQDKDEVVIGDLSLIRLFVKSGFLNLMINHQSQLNVLIWSQYV